MAEIPPGWLLPLRMTWALLELKANTTADAVTLNRLRWIAPTLDRAQGRLLEHALGLGADHPDIADAAGTGHAETDQHPALLAATLGPTRVTGLGPIQRAVIKS